MYFFDTYAIIEILKNNPKYFSYREYPVIITQLNIIEITYSVLLEYGEDNAKIIYGRFQDCVQEINQEIILQALKFRKQYNKRNLSYANCIGYTYAIQNNLKFLTGDDQFKDLPQIEFVKK